MAGFEGFTVLAIIEARDKASEIFEKCGISMEKLGESAGETADVIKGASEEIDESLLSTASGADALELATAKVSAAQERAAAAADAQAQAEQRLIAVTAQGAASQEEQAAAATALADAQGRAAEAEATAAEAASAQAAALAALAAETAEGSAAAGLYADANGKLRNSAGQFVSAADAQEIAVQAVTEAEGEGSAAAGALAEANERLAAAQKASADAATEASAAQARQDALLSSDDVAVAGQNLAKADKAAQSASAGLSAAQAKQATVQKTLAASTDEAKAAALAEADAQKKAAADAEASSALLGKVGKVAGISALGLGVAGGLMVKAAGNFQDSTAHLQTDAGVTAGNLGAIRAGILQVSTATGQSAENITNAMYHIASSGFNTTKGLGILKVAAEGARVGGADLDTTSKALVGTLTAYYGTQLSAGQATKDSTSLMNQLIQTVGSGDMRMQDLASSLSTVTPVAAAAGISFSQVGGAIATMTGQGMTARQATQDLANTIRNLKSPNNVASTEMRALGLNANTVSQNLGKKGLAGTLDELRNAVLSNTHGGVVMLGYLKEMTPAAQGLANQIMAGKISTGALTTAMKGLNPQQDALVTKFKAAAVSATGLKQTYTGAMAKMLGGATGLNTALMLTGTHMGDLTKNTAAIAAKTKDASGDVDNWSTIQGTFNFKVAQAKTAVENTGIAIGSALLPAVSALFSAVSKILIPIAEFTAKHKTLTEILFVGVTAFAATVAVLALTAKVIKTVTGAVNEVKGAYNGAIALMRKLGTISKQTADTQKKDATETAQAQEAKAGESAAVQEEQSAEAAAAQEADAAEAAGANEVAAGESSGSWIAAAATTAGGWAKAGGQMIATAAKWVAGGAVKVAAYVAENVGGALATAGAWMAANAVMLLGIGLVVALVAIAVVEIVKHWHAIVDGVKDAWNTVYSFISKIISDVISFVKSHWVLIVGIFTGPLGLAVVEIVKHFTQIKAFASKIVSDVISFVKSHWQLIISILGGPLVAAVVLITKYWHDIEHWFETGVSTVLSILRGLGHDVISLGGDVVRGIWSGITGMAGWLWGKVSGFAGSMLDHLKSAFGIGSPSKVTTVHGQMLAAGVAAGITAGTPQALQKATAMAEQVIAATKALNAAKSGAMHQAGAGIVQGIWNGISGSASWLASNITGFASSVLHGISSALGIGSPSKYTTVHGQMLGQGLANGILASVPRAVAAARQMAASVLGATSSLSAARPGAPVTGSPLAASAISPASSAANGGVTIHVHVTGNTVIGDSDISKLTERIGKKLSSTTLPAAGRKFNIRG